MRRIAVKIRTARDEQLEARGEVAVPVRRGLVVIGMIGLERIETCGAVCGNPLVDGGLSRVRERGEAAGAVHQRNDLLWRRTAARHKRRTSGGQPAVERLTRVRDITGRDHRARDLRTSHGPPSVFARLRDQRTDVDGHAELREQTGDGFHARDSLSPLSGEEP